jgi:hypothetical protein
VEGDGGTELEENTAGDDATGGAEPTIAAPHLLQKLVPGAMLAPQELQNAIRSPRADWCAGGWREYTAD